MIHCETCKTFQVDHTNKWYMQNPYLVTENETLKLLWDFGIQTYHQISARRAKLIIIKIFQKNQRVKRYRTMSQKTYQRNKYWSCLHFKIFGAIFKVNQRIWTNGPRNTKTNDHTKGITFQIWRWQTRYVQKRRRKRTCQHWIESWRIKATTWRLHTKAWRKLITATRNILMTRGPTERQLPENENGRKPTIWTFKATNKPHRIWKKTWTWQRKGNLKREMKSLLIATQNNAIRTNHIKARIDKMQQTSKCWLCGDRDETINQLIS